MVRVGLLGTGFVATFYMKGLQHTPGAQVTAVGGHSLKSAQEFARVWNIPSATDDIWSVAYRDDVDLVVIALPNFLHLEAAKRTAPAHKPLVSSKPMGRSEHEARQMLEIAETAGVTHGYAETEVFCPAVVHTESLIRGGTLGGVHTVRVRESHQGPHSRWFYDPALSGGGALRDMGCHCVEVGRYFIGKSIRPVEVFAWGAAYEHPGEVEDTAVALMRFENDAMVETEVGWATHGGLDLRNEVHTSKGAAFTDVTRSTPLRAFVMGQAGYVVEKAESESGWIYPVVDEAEAYGYAGEMRHFVECAEKGIMPRETWRDGVIVSAILDRMYLSMKERQWVSLTDIPELEG